MYIYLRNKVIPVQVDSLSIRHILEQYPMDSEIVAKVFKYAVENLRFTGKISWRLEDLYDDGIISHELKVAAEFWNKFYFGCWFVFTKTGRLTLKEAEPYGLPTTLEKQKELYLNWGERRQPWGELYTYKLVPKRKTQGRVSGMRYGDIDEVYELTGRAF